VGFVQEDAGEERASVQPYEVPALLRPWGRSRGLQGSQITLLCRLRVTKWEGELNCMTEKLVVVFGPVLSWGFQWGGHPLKDRENPTCVGC